MHAFRRIMGTMFLVGALVCLPGVVDAQIPNTISYQGILTNASIPPAIVPDGNYNLVFKLYTVSTGGSAFWTETRSNVPVTEGRFWVELGSLTPLTGVSFGAAYFLGITVNSGVELPRIPLTASAYSLNARRVATVDSATGGNITSKVSIGPGHTNTGINAFVAGSSNTVLGRLSTICGGEANSIDSAYGTIGGGNNNHVGGTFSTIGGGDGNSARSNQSTIGGGVANFTRGLCATVGGGSTNNADGQGAFVGGGLSNYADGFASAVAGGYGNVAGSVSAGTGNHSFVGGGYSNKTEGQFSVIAGGKGNQAAGDYSSISGGFSDTITASGDYSYLFGIGSKLTQDSTFMVDMPHIRFGKEAGGYEFPTVDGANGQVLKTNGSGRLNWAASPGVPIPLTLSGSLSGPLLDVDQAGPSAAVDISNTNGATTTAYIGTTNEGVVGFRSMNAGRLGRLDCGALGSYNFPVQRYGMLGTATHGVFGKDSSSGNWGALGSVNHGVYGSSTSAWAGYFSGKLEASIDANGALSRPLVLTNPGNTSGTAVSMLFKVDGGENRGKGGIAYERTNTWNRGDMHFLQSSAATLDIADLSNAVMTIKNDGSIGVGTKSPAEKLEIKGSLRLDAGAGVGQMMRFTDGGVLKWALAYRPWASGKLSLSNDAPGGMNLMTFDALNNRVGIAQDNPAYPLDVSGSCHASSFPTSSDIRLKKNIQPLGSVLDKVERLNGVSFDWNETYDSLGRSTGHREIGVIAQDVEAQFPELVTWWSDQNYRAVDYGRLTAVLIEAVKELRAENRAMTKRLAELELLSKSNDKPGESLVSPAER